MRGVTLTQNLQHLATSRWMAQFHVVDHEFVAYLCMYVHDPTVAG